MQRLITAFLIALATWGGTAAGAQRGVLPDFTVRRSDRTEIPSSQIGVAGTWVLVYVQPGCRLCDVMLRAIDGAHEQLAGRVTVIVGGATTADIEAISQRYSRLPASAWHADVGMTAFTRLAMPGTPFLMGVRGRDVEWTLSGVLADTDTVQSVLRSWIAKN